MEVLEIIRNQVQVVQRPVFAVTLTAVACKNTPVLLTVHWHGFAHSGPTTAQAAKDAPPASIPSSAMQVNAPWMSLDRIDDAMLHAAWQLGAWDLTRDERRGCNVAGASEREALECRQAFADTPYDAVNPEDLVLAEAPDRDELMHLGARLGYVVWQFQPVNGGIWRNSTADETLRADGSREPPCPVAARPSVGTRLRHTRYHLGHSSQIVLLG